MGIPVVERSMESNGNLPYDTECLKKEDINYWFFELKKRRWGT